MTESKDNQRFYKKKQQETLEISSTGYGFESVLTSEDWGNNVSAQKQGNLKSRKTD